MVNKKGASDWLSRNWLVVLIVVGIAALYGVGTGFSFTNFVGEKGFSDAFSQDGVSFSSAWNNPAFSNLDFVFGQIPGYLVELTNGTSAGIVVIGIWLLFVFIFYDIIYLFGMFSKNVNMIVALLLALILANLAFIKVVAVIALTLTAFLGALSVFASLISIFVVFLLFHWGTSGIRQSIILRRAEDQAVRAVAGGDVAASGIEVLRKVANKAADATRKKKK